MKGRLQTLKHKDFKKKIIGVEEFNLQILNNLNKINVF